MAGYELTKDDIRTLRSVGYETPEIEKIAEAARTMRYTVQMYGGDILETTWKTVETMLGHERFLQGICNARTDMTYETDTESNRVKRIYFDAGRYFYDNHIKPVMR